MTGGIVGLLVTISMISFALFVLMIPLIFFAMLGLIAYAFALAAWKHHNKTCRHYVGYAKPVARTRNKRRR